MIVHCAGIGNEAEGCVIAESLESSRKKAVEAMVGSGIEDVRGRRFRQGREKNSAEVFYFRRVSRVDELLNFSVLKELEL